MAEASYTLTVIKDVYFVTNDSVLSMSYNLKKIDECTGLITTIVTGTISPMEIKEISFPTDGTYEILLLELGGSFNESTIHVKYTLNLQLSMIEDIFTVLCPCDCGCVTCVDLNTSQCEALLTAKNKVDVFKYLSYPRFDAVLTLVHKRTACFIEPQLYCDITQEGVTGQIEYNSLLTKQLIAIDYLAMYFAELKLLIEQEDIDYINTKYQSSTVLCCIKKLGINIKEIQTLINDMAAGTITSGAYVYQPPTDVGFLSVAKDNRGVALALTVANFTENVAVYPPAANNPNPSPSDNVFYSIRIDSLLVGLPTGTLTLLGVDVIVGQIIPLSAVAIGSLTYLSPNTDDVDVDTFTYSVSNVGAPTIFSS
jgi:hypothetical protein